MKTINCKYGTFGLEYKDNEYGKYYDVFNNNTWIGELHNCESLSWKEIAEQLESACENNELMF